MASASLAVSICAVIFTCLGWFISFWLNSRIQRRALVNSITNDARVVLTDAFRDLQDWLTEILACVHAYEPAKDGNDPNVWMHNNDRARAIYKLSTDLRHMKWARRLEEYQALFPATERALVGMMQLTMQLTDTARQIAELQRVNDPVPQTHFTKFEEEAIGVLGLSSDLLSYLLNVTLGQITGHVFKARTAKKGAILKLDRDGMLQVIHSDGS